MAWGSSKPKAPPPPRHTFTALIPLILFLVVVAGGFYIGYQIYQSSRQIGHAYKDKMERKNVVFTKSGMKVGVKEVRNEKYVDKTQSIFVKAWNLSTWPAYKSRLWNKENPAEVDGVKERMTYSQ